MSKCNYYCYGDVCNKTGILHPCSCKGEAEYCTEKVVTLYDVGDYILHSTNKVKLEIIIDMAKDRLEELDK